MTASNRNVLLVGAYPPPHNGISVHVERLRRGLAEAYDVRVLDLYGAPRPGDESGVVRCGPKRSPRVLRALWTLHDAGPAIVHFHVTSLDAFLYLAHPMLAAVHGNARRIITIHSGSFVGRFERASPLRRALLQSVLGRFDRVVAVSEEQHRFLRSVGVADERSCVVPAFLPPVVVETPAVRALRASLGACDRLIVSSGALRSFYGFHLILDALERAQRADSRVGVLLCTYGDPDPAYAAAIEARVRAHPQWKIVRDLSPGAFAWLLRCCDAYVRATDRDGDAVAVREALAFGTRVVASDCVTRPSGVELFTTGDAAALGDALARTYGRASGAACDDGSRNLAGVRAAYVTASRK
ncbi:MAG: hypothetical protein NVS1B2_26810 [Vulcanimicrobiaceae bacterium]